MVMVGVHEAGLFRMPVGCSLVVCYRRAISPIEGTIYAGIETTRGDRSNELCVDDKRTAVGVRAPRAQVW